MGPSFKQTGARRRRGGPPPLSARLARVTGAVFRRQGFAEAHIIRHWAAIVGAELAGATSPERLRPTRGDIRGAALVVRVDGAFALEIQHLEPQILERINAYYGYSAVARLKLKQGPLPARPAPAPRPAALTGEEQAAIDAALASMPSDDLKDALGRLGRRVMAAAKSRR